ncbi:MAG: sulfite exporter TauE/SafE family protein, partial [Deltaproteobacteria bacterium]|nr:sulfite exporter TauE/SafE family protein [Deltaproteobacteria bacterium]
MAYIVASGIKGLTGLGFSTSCLPILALRLDLKVAIPLVIIPSIVSNVTLMIQAGRFREVVRRFWPLYVATIPGLLVGLFILISINVDVARAILGLVLVSYTLFALSNRPFRLSGDWERKLKIVVGLSTGFVNGLTGSQIMPVLPFLMSLNLHRMVFVQAINISFTLSSIVMLFGMNHLGYL